MPELNEIVEVNISRESQGVTRAGFGVPMVLADCPVALNQVTTYTSAAAMLLDGFLNTDYAYLAALKAFSQSPKPQLIKVAKTSAAVAQVLTLTPQVANAQEYTVNLSFPAVYDDVSYSTTSDADATAAEIVDAIVIEINNGAIALEHNLVASNVANELVLTHSVAGASFSATFEAADFVQASLVSANGPVQDFALALAADKDFYLLDAETRAGQVMAELALQIESISRLYMADSSDAATLAGTASTSLAKLLQNTGVDRTIYMQHASASDAISGGWYGKCLPKDPGSITWKFKNLNAISGDSYSDSQIANVKAMGGNVYVPYGGVDSTAEGVTVSGEFIDTIRGIDWLTSRMQEDVANLLLNADKVPYTDVGVSLLENKVRARLQTAVNVGILSSFEITAGAVADQDGADKAARIYRGLGFTGVLAGAIHKTVINGIVTL